MHYRLLVTIDADTDKCKDSESARRLVFDRLAADPSFVGQGGRFGSPCADWFVIGGRWSGFLSEITWAKEVVAEIEKMESEIERPDGVRVFARGQSGGPPDMVAAREELQRKAEAAYAEAVPDEYHDKGLKYARDTYQQYGYEDDAVIVTTPIYDALLAEYEGFDLVRDTELDRIPRFVDWSWDGVGPDFVGKKWLVVVDAHF